MNVEKRTLSSLDVLEVPGKKEAGAVLLFHGFGADAQDLLPLAFLYPDLKWIFPNGPLEVSIAPGYTGRAWFDVNIELLQKALQKGSIEAVKQAFPEEFSQIRTLGEELIAELDIPLSKLFIGGFSQGAVLATEIALNAFASPAALLILSGTLINKKSWTKRATLRAGMPFFQSHGQHDPLLPFEMAEDLEQLLQKGGLKGELHPFAGGHEIPQSTCQQLTHFFQNITASQV